MKHVITSVLATYMLANAATAIEMYNVAGSSFAESEEPTAFIAPYATQFHYMRQGVNLPTDTSLTGFIDTPSSKLRYTDVSETSDWVTSLRWGETSYEPFAGLIEGSQGVFKGPLGSQLSGKTLLTGFTALTTVKLFEEQVLIFGLNAKLHEGNACAASTKVNGATILKEQGDKPSYKMAVTMPEGVYDIETTIRCDEEALTLNKYDDNPELVRKTFKSVEPFILTENGEYLELYNTHVASKSFMRPTRLPKSVQGYVYDENGNAISYDFSKPLSVLDDNKIQKVVKFTYTPTEIGLHSLNVQTASNVLSNHVVMRDDEVLSTIPKIGQSFHPKIYLKATSSTGVIEKAHPPLSSQLPLRNIPLYFNVPSRAVGQPVEILVAVSHTEGGDYQTGFQKTEDGGFYVIDYANKMRKGTVDAVRMNSELDYSIYIADEKIASSHLSPDVSVQFTIKTPSSNDFRFLKEAEIVALGDT